MATELQQCGPQTGSRSETQCADFDAYFASEEFESLVNKAVSTNSLVLSHLKSLKTCSLPLQNPLLLKLYQTWLLMKLRSYEVASTSN
jgi:hypothetical protein